MDDTNDEATMRALVRAEVRAGVAEGLNEARDKWLKDIDYHGEHCEAVKWTNRTGRILWIAIGSAVTAVVAAIVSWIKG